MLFLPQRRALLGRIAPEVVAWITAGASLNSTEVTAYSRFFTAHRSQLGAASTFWDWLQFFSGASLTQGPLLQVIGSGTVTAPNFVGADYSRGFGIKGVPASAKRLIVPVTAGSRSHTSGGFMLMATEMDYANYRYYMGWQVSGSACHLVGDLTTIGARWGNPSPTASHSATNASGIWISSAVSATDLRLFYNGTQVATTATARTAMSGSENLSVFAGTVAGGSGTFFSAMRAFGYGVLRAGITPSQASTATALLQQLRADLSWPTL